MDPNAKTPALEQASSGPDVRTEQLASQNPEVRVAPAAAEAAQNGPKADDGAAVTAQAQVAAITADDATAVQSVPTADGATTVPAPLTANEVDVIEPEWVKKAEEAVAKHRDDPHAEEDAVEQVQIQYLKTRYNLDVAQGDKKP